MTPAAGHATARASVAGAGVVRVGIVVGRLRLDVAVPDGVRVAELVPEVVAAAGGDDVHLLAGQAPALVTVTGRRLDPAADLRTQDVLDGALLAVVPVAEVDDDLLPHDDVAAAVAEVVEAGARRSGGPVARAPLVAAGVLHGIGILALVLASPAAVAPAALGMAVVLLAVAAVAARAGLGAPAVAVAVAACVHAAVAGALAAPADEPPLGLPAAVAGSALAVCGAVALALLQRRRLLLLPAVLVGAAVATASLLARATGADPVAVAMTVLVLAVLAGPLHPRVTVATTSLGAYADPRGRAGPSLREAATEVRLAQEVALALLTATAALLVLLTPVAVARGAAGTALAAACAVALAAGGARHRDTVLRATSALTGSSCLLLVAATALVAHPAWRAGVAAAALAGAVAATAAALRTGPPGPRWVRVQEVAEAAALVALLPLLGLASGVVDALVHLVGGAAGVGR